MSPCCSCFSRVSAFSISARSVLNWVCRTRNWKRACRASRETRSPAATGETGDDHAGGDGDELRGVARAQAEEGEAAPADVAAHQVADVGDPPADEDEERDEEEAELHQEPRATSRRPSRRR